MIPTTDRADILELSGRIRAVVGHLIRRVRNESGTSLSWSQSALLSALDRRPRSTASQLAMDNGLRTQTVWATVDILVARGLAERARDPEDRRNVRITLTSAGLEELLSDRQVREQWIVDVLMHEFSDPERNLLVAVIPLLERLAGSARTLEQDR